MNWIAWLAAAIAAAVMALLLVAVVGRVLWTRSTRALVAQLEKTRLPASPSRYSDDELDGLPAPVQRYFRAALKDGQPIIRSLALEQTGMFNMSTSCERWVAFKSKQCVVVRRPGFVWNARMQAAPGLVVRVHDAYLQGEGVLRVAAFGLFTVAQLHGPGEVARGELMRFLAEATWYPTALLPSQGVQWRSVDGNSADATFIDGGVGVTLRFHFDAAGLIDCIRADARGAAVGKATVMTPWECRLWGYQERDGMRIPLVGEVAWLWPQGRRAYWRGTITRLKYEVA